LSGVKQITEVQSLMGYTAV